MSIRRKPEKAVPVLRARLLKAKEDAIGQEFLIPGGEHPLLQNFKEIEKELSSMDNLWPKMKQWEKSVLEQCCVLEQAIDDEIFKDREKIDEIRKKLELIKDDLAKLNNLVSRVGFKVTSKLNTMSFRQQDLPEEENDHEMSEEWANLGLEAEIFVSAAMLNLQASFNCLESFQLKVCLLFLSVFPENSIIKKRPLIYWWIGEGLVTKTKNKTAEEVGEDVFQELIDEGFIKPEENKSPNVNACSVHPWIRRMLIMVAQKKALFSFGLDWALHNGLRHAFLLSGKRDSYLMSNGEKEEDLLTVFNVNEQYLGLKPDWLSKLKRVEVLQLGRWRNSVKHHIEVENPASLNGLGSQKHLRYLSLRGISRIEALPPSVVRLISLKILDLRACHNLEKLPSGISALRNLTHLDVSDCYLLESMPKGIEQLSALQVLKGFVMSSVGKNPCRLSALVRLKNLRKLSIRIGNEVVHDELHMGFVSLSRFTSLQILVISCGVVSLITSLEDAFRALSAPPKLRKLDLRCVPLDTLPEGLWPTRLPHLEKLYIKGGKLRRLDHKDGQEWKVRIVRLRYLKNLAIEENQLTSMFPEWAYLEVAHCKEHGQDFSLSRAAEEKRPNMI